MQTARKDIVYQENAEWRALMRSIDDDAFRIYIACRSFGTSRPINYVPPLLDGFLANLLNIVAKDLAKVINT